jgi:hypothetical protein
MAAIDPEKLKEAAPKLLKGLLEAYFFCDECVDCLSEALDPRSCARDGDLLMLTLRRSEDPPDYYPHPPGPRERVVEAIIIAAATALFTKAAEFIYDEIKMRRSKAMKNMPPVREEPS